LEHTVHTRGVVGSSPISATVKPHKHLLVRFFTAFKKSASIFKKIFFSIDSSKNICYLIQAFEIRMAE
ncbi:MAG: hypothetical protein ACLR9Q_15230, partial [Enterocloster sp.]